MKTLVRSSRGHLRYTGKITRESFSLWADSPAGRKALEDVAARVRFSLFGRMRAARKKTWRELIEASRANTVGLVLQHETDAYLSRLDTFAYADRLPYVMVDLRRIIVVPRVFVNGEAHRRIQRALQTQPLFAGLSGGDSLRRWFTFGLIDSLAGAVIEAQPSIRRPLPAGEGWVVVGVDEDFQWQVPFDGPAWPGHYFVLELTRRPLTRAVNKAAADAITHLAGALPSLTVIDRTEIMRRAGLSLDQLFGNRTRAVMSRSA
jgi:hypothetical protein